MIEIPLLLPVPENLQRDPHDGYLAYYSDDFIKIIQNLLTFSFYNNSFKIEVPMMLKFETKVLKLKQVPLYYHLYDTSLSHYVVLPNGTLSGIYGLTSHDTLNYYSVSKAPNNQILFKLKMKSDWLNSADADVWLNEIYTLQVPRRNDVSTNHLWLQLHGNYKINKKVNKLIDVKPSSITCELLLCNRKDLKPELPWKKQHHYNNQYTLPVFTFPENI